MPQSIQPAVLAWLREREADMIGLLESIVNIDSGSRHKAGIDEVAAVLQAHLEQAGVQVTGFAQANHGNCLLAEVPSPAPGAQGHVVLLGHMDTVFPQGTAQRRSFRIDNATAYGPGVADMKAGLVMNTFIACAFARLGGNRHPLRVLYTGDEEIASPSSRQLTMEVARGALAVFNAEPGRPSGNLVTGRKGALFVDFEVTGTAAHAGVNHAQGASAIGALAGKIVALHELTDYGTGVTANVGTVQGGTSVNTVASHAAAQLDLRFPGEVDRQDLYAKVLAIIGAENVVGTHARVTHEGSFLPLSCSEQSRRLLQAYQRAATQVGFAVEGEYTGGSADSGLTAAVGAPTLCGTGPVGGHVHTEREYCRIDTLVPRAQAIALTLLEGHYG